MANAANYLSVSEGRITQSYKLRTRTVQAKSFVVTNTTDTHRLDVEFSVSLEGVTINPSSLSLQPRESRTISVLFDTGILETYPVGVIEDTIQALVSAQTLVSVQEPPAPVIVPPEETPPAPPTPPVQPVSDEIVVSVSPISQLIEAINQPVQYSAQLFVNGEIVTGAQFNWSLNSDDNFAINDSGIVTTGKVGEYSASVRAEVKFPSEYSGAFGTSIVNSKIGINTGNIEFNVRGLVSELTPVIDLTGPVNRTLTQFIRQQDGTRTKIVSEVPVGQYTAVPSALTTLNGISYISRFSSPVIVEPGKTTVVDIFYIALTPPIENNFYSIEIVSVGRIPTLSSPNATNIITNPTETIKVGDEVGVSFFVYRNGSPRNVGPVPVNFTGTFEGTVIAEEGDTSVSIPVIGLYSARFTAKTSGQQTISISHENALRTFEVEFLQNTPEFITIYCQDIDIDRFDDPSNCQEYRVFPGESCFTLSTRLVECDPNFTPPTHSDVPPPPHFDAGTPIRVEPDPDDIIQDDEGRSIPDNDEDTLDDDDLDTPTL